MNAYLDNLESSKFFASIATSIIFITITVFLTASPSVKSSSFVEQHSHDESGETECSAKPVSNVIMAQLLL